MKSKKDFLPIIIAFFIALVITGIVRWLIPSISSQSTNSTKKIDEISMPEIPLMVEKPKEKKQKIIENYVLLVSKDIKKDEKIKLDQLTWKKWPHEAMQPYFIAKDENETPLNNGADYTNALKMWAKSDIPNGVPLTMTMLTNEDPQKKEAEEKKKKEEEELRRLEEERAHSFVKNGMRAITFSIDQKSASSSHMFSAGDLVDVLIIEQRGDKIKTHKYKAIKILAIDGITKFNNTLNKKDNNGDNTSFFEKVSMRSVGSFLTPKTVTLEVKEEMVEQMLKQANNTGVILSIRNQSETVDQQGTYEIDDNEHTFSEANSILSNIMSLNQSNPTDALIKEQAKKEAEEKNLEVLMNNINMINNIEDNLQKTTNTANDTPNNTINGKDVPEDTQYEVVSGKIVGEEEEEESKPNFTMVYRKLTPTAIQFDEDGKITTDNNTQGNASISQTSNFSTKNTGRSKKSK